jgi:short-subunit dehydrogenase
MTGRHVESLDARRKEIDAAGRADVEMLAADLTVRADVERLAADLAGRDDLEILVNNAGMVAPGPFAAIPIATQLAMIDVHATSTVRLCRAVLPGMMQRRRGIVINVSSMGGLTPDAADVTYSASKRFVIHFSRALAAAVAGSGVEIQALCPGFTRTKMHDALGTLAIVPSTLWMDPPEVVDESLAAIGAGVVCIPGRRNRLLARLLRYPALMRLAMRG